MARILGFIISIAGFAGLYFSQLLENESWLKISALTASLLVGSIGLGLGITRKNIVNNVSRIFVGIIFAYSGFVKVVDPLGTNYMIEDYFSAWGLESLHPIAIYCAILLCVGELVTGIALIFNLWMKKTSWVLLAFMIYFTPLTLYIALYNPVTDCGCFGEALIITNWQTFWKNVIILIPTFIIFRNRKQFSQIINTELHIYPVALIIAACTYISLLNIWHLPWVDFRPYHVGANLSEKISDGTPEVAEYFFVYENNATKEIKEVHEKEAGNVDANEWTYLDFKKRVITPGHDHSIHDFNIYNNEKDVTENILHDEGYSFWVIMYDLSKADIEHVRPFIEIEKIAKSKQIPFSAITASYEEIPAFKKQTGLQCEYFNMDKIQLKTWIRSNPGLVLIKNGVIIGKWHYNDIPSPDEMKNIVK